jgi:hypothetical protein
MWVKNLFTLVFMTIILLLFLLNFQGRNQSRSMDRHHSGFPYVCRIDRRHDKGMNDLHFIIILSPLNQSSVGLI